ncbi:heavy metal translocating P-type ATPase [Exiguobacterium sp. BRG2]|uniref:heavy metal translocating P-type ATPase n=1 Tax=Exiguobacterium sp. BRG2 TaxID=2962584 RepID=UPI00288205D7|nr:heavy metal translocating P-type ATPase [Exiguobacterium sp. BRG2]MDT0173915.1 heavy metal translocating P-type ATPase [Exiguobacterium sp. BRG2]
MREATEPIRISGIDCANCAAKVERGVANVTGVKEATLDFAGQRLYITYASPDIQEQTYRHVVQRVHELEPDALLQREQDTRDTTEMVFWTRSKKLQTLIGLTSFGIAFLVPESIQIWLYLTAYVFIGNEVLRNALRSTRRGQLFDENFLMMLATIGAFVIGEYTEAVAVMLFYQIGEYFQHRAVNQSRRSISALMDIRPQQAVLEDGRRVRPEDVIPGQRIIVRAGERIPLDGTIKQGTAFLDTAALTGESVPRRVHETDHVLAGTISTDGQLVIEVDRSYTDSAVAKIISLVEQASRHKAPTEKFITRFARVYTPAVVVIALILAVLPPLLLNASFSEWTYRALVFLVISCPCALMLSIPLGFFSGIGAASKRGILVKGGNHLESLQRIDTLVLDKTGTLTKGNFEVVAIQAHTMTKQELLQVAARVERQSNHPIATSIVRAVDGLPSKDGGIHLSEIAGKGVSGEYDGRLLRAGNAEWLKELGFTPDKETETGTYVHITQDQDYLGWIRIADQLKTTTMEAIIQLKKRGIRRIVMLTGDRKQTAEAIKKQLDLDHVIANLLPHQKVEALEELMKTAKGKTAFVGDGINDAPVLTRADVGIAMGGLGSDVAIEAADVVLMTDEPKQLADAMDVARTTRKIVYQNIYFALGIKAIFLLLGAFGIATMWEAVFADVGVTVLAVLNAMRLLKIRA